MKSKKRRHSKGGTQVDTKKSSTIGFLRPEQDDSLMNAPKRNGIHILLVEDDSDHREALTYLLEEEGYDVSSACHGLEAIERLRWGLQPAAILLDMRMHVMNGWEFRRELKRVPGFRSIPVLVMSGATLKLEDLEGCGGWIPKPVKAAELLKKLDECTRAQVQIR